MTIKEALDGGTSADELANPGGMREPAPPRELKEAGVRHLAYGSSPTTLCGLDRSAVSTAHPTKAKKTDCQACRDAYRLGRAGKVAAKGGPDSAGSAQTLPPPKNAREAFVDAMIDSTVEEGRPQKFGKGDHVELLDGSVWHVEDVRVSGSDLRCLIGGGSYKRGATTTIGSTSGVRVFKPGEFDALVADSKRKAEAAKLPPTVAAAPLGGPPTARPATGKWAPTAAEVAEVKRLRALGHSFIKIEKALDWPDGHGNRPWRIMQGLVQARDEQPAPAAEEKSEAPEK
jgi:hypothetical protein